MRVHPSRLGAISGGNRTVDALYGRRRHHDDRHRRRLQRGTERGAPHPRRDRPRKPLHQAGAGHERPGRAAGHLRHLLLRRGPLRRAGLHPADGRDAFNAQRLRLCHRQVPRRLRGAQLLRRQALLRVARLPDLGHVRKRRPRRAVLPGGAGGPDRHLGRDQGGRRAAEGAGRGGHGRACCELGAQRPAGDLPRSGRNLRHRGRRDARAG